MLQRSGWLSLFRLCTGVFIGKHKAVGEDAVECCCLLGLRASDTGHTISFSISNKGIVVKTIDVCSYLSSLHGLLFTCG